MAHVENVGGARRQEGDAGDHPVTDQRVGLADPESGLRSGADAALGGLRSCGRQGIGKVGKVAKSQKVLQLWMCLDSFAFMSAFRKDALAKKAQVARSPKVRRRACGKAWWSCVPHPAVWHTTWSTLPPSLRQVGKWLSQQLRVCVCVCAYFAEAKRG